ncbi:MAG: ankyrin repeat domain-containing protein [Deltaproteobacteria bacterium]|nr:ankyrin repeat domain-containing protein [Deltaproteobacteria bacterium]
MNRIAKLLCLVVILLAFYGCASGQKTVVKKDGGPEMLRPVDADLVAAIKKKDAAAVKALLKKGADPNVIYDNKGHKCSAELPKCDFARVPLLDAIESDSDEIVTALLDGGADVEAKMFKEMGQKPLLHAVRIAAIAYGGSDSSIVRLLLDRKADPNAASIAGTPVLAMAIVFEHLEIIKLLLDKGAKVYFTTEFLETRYVIYDTKELGGGSSSVLSSLCYNENKTAGEKEKILREFKKRGFLTKEFLNDTLVGCVRWPNDGNQSAIGLLLDFGADKDATDMLSESPLDVALKAGNGVAARFLINKGARLDLKGGSGSKYLVLAARSLDVELVEYILKKGVKINSVDASNDVALSVVLKNFGIVSDPSYHEPRIKMAEYLLSMGADMNMMLGEEPLLFAVAKATSVEGVKFLLRKGVDINKKDKQGRGVAEAYKAYTSVVGDDMTALLSGESSFGLFSAVKAGDMARVKELIEEKNIEINSINDSGETPLYLAAASANGTMVEYLIKRGASLNAKENVKGKTALHAAIENGNIMTVNTLVAAGVNVTSEDNEGRRPVHYAVMINDEEKLRAIARAGADMNARDFEGVSSLHMALLKGNMKIAAVLVSLGANINVMNNLGDTPLHGAVTSKAAEAVEFLISSGSSVNAKNNEGRTPLHAAVTSGEYKTVKLLASVSGADVNAQDKTGITPLHLAALAGRDDMAFILIKRGASVSLKNNDGKSALDIARESKKQKLVDVVTNVRPDAL